MWKLIIGVDGAISIFHHCATAVIMIKNKYSPIIFKTHTFQKLAIVSNYSCDYTRDSIGECLLKVIMGGDRDICIFHQGVTAFTMVTKIDIAPSPSKLMFL